MENMPGERYDGEWNAGEEDGLGIFTWTDGSTYDGFWCRSKKHGLGVRDATSFALCIRCTSVWRGNHGLICGRKGVPPMHERLPEDNRID